VDDEELLARAEQALTEIKVARGLSDQHASVLAALRIRLKGSAGKSLEEMLEAAGDLRPRVSRRSWPRSRASASPRWTTS